MSELVWEPYINEISRAQGKIAKSKRLIFKILPGQYSMELRIQKAYTGALLKILNFEDLNLAISIAEQIHSDCLAGWDIHDLLKRF